MGEGYSRNSQTGVMYQGTFENDLPNGLGIESKADGSIYEGNFEKGEYNGRGKITKLNEEITGNFLTGFMHGKGGFKNTLTGESFQGTYDFGSINGHGIQILSNHEKYEGNFRSGQRNGQGTCWKDHTDDKT